MLTYRYTWEGSRMIVYEYEGGRRGHKYVGHFANGFGVLLVPVKGGYDPDSRVPYEKKHTNVFKLTRLPDYGSPAPAPIEPPVRISPRADEPAEPTEPEALDNSRYVGEQMKII